MATLARYYNVSPVEFRSLALDEVAALLDHHEAVINAQRRAQRR